MKNEQADRKKMFNDLIEMFDSVGLSKEKAIFEKHLKFLHHDKMVEYMDSIRGILTPIVNAQRDSGWLEWATSSAFSEEKQKVEKEIQKKYADIFIKRTDSEDNVVVEKGLSDVEVHKIIRQGVESVLSKLDKETEKIERNNDIAEQVIDIIKDAVAKGQKIENIQSTFVQKLKSLSLSAREREKMQAVQRLIAASRAPMMQGLDKLRKERDYKAAQQHMYGEEYLAGFTTAGDLKKEDVKVKKLPEEQVAEKGKGKGKGRVADMVAGLEVKGRPVMVMGRKLSAKPKIHSGVAQDAAAKGESSKAQAAEGKSSKPSVSGSLTHRTLTRPPRPQGRRPSSIKKRP